MITATTALFLRTLRLDTRAFRGYGLRVVLGGMVLLILASMQSFSFTRSAAGLDLIRTIVWCAFACITLAGLSHFCSAITEEKEEGTLGLMRMAGLDPVAILLAKSTARLWDALLLTATMLPFATLAVTLGGVSLAQVMACAVALGAYVFMIANIGLLCSVVMRTTQAASSLATMVLLALMFGPWVLAVSGASGSMVLGPLQHGLEQASVMSRLNAVLNTGYSQGVIGAQCWLDVAIGATCFGLAWLAFDRCAERVGELAPSSLVVRRKSRMNILSPGRPGVGLAAVVWKDFHFLAGGRLMWVVKLAMAAGLTAFIAYLTSARMGSSWAQCGQSLLLIAVLWFILEIGMHLTRIFAFETRGQTLDGLVSLPFDLSSIAYAKLRSVVPALVPVIAFLLMSAVMTGGSLSNIVEALAREPAALCATVVCVLYFWHTCAYISLVVRRGALAAAIGLMILTYVALLIPMIVLNAISSSGSGIGYS
ncbi:MAG: hypothetical protein H0W83_12190, partial [Planctomycetes bacterium]|nr:hypothetical protein [Planctomycetota bacterium]